MATAITIEGTSIQTDDFITEFIQHDSSPPINLQTAETARGVGEVLVGANIRPKTIKIRTLVRGDNQSDLETNIDAFKGITHGVNLELKVDYKGGSLNRVYVISLDGEVQTAREARHITHAIFDLTYKVLDAYGKDGAEEELL